MTRIVTVALSDETGEKLSRLAQQTGKSEDLLAAELLDEQVKYDTYYRDAVAQGLQALEDGRVVSHEDVASRMEQIWAERR